MQILLKEYNQKKLSGHPNIVQFVSAASIGKDESDNGQSEYLVLMELCTGGALVDAIQAKGASLSCDEVLQIFFQTCKAVSHMHKQKPPITHMDLKVSGRWASVIVNIHNYVFLKECFHHTSQLYCCMLVETISFGWWSWLAGFVMNIHGFKFMMNTKTWILIIVIHIYSLFTNILKQSIKYLFYTNLNNKIWNCFTLYTSWRTYWLGLRER